MATKSTSKAVTMDDVWEELRIANRLMIASLALRGVQQKDIAAVIGRADSVVSEMYPKGLLRKLAKSNSLPAED